MLITCLRGLAYLLQVSESGFEPRNQRGCGHTLVEGPKAHTTPSIALGVCGGKQGTQCYRVQCVGSPSCLVQRGCEDEALWGSGRWLPPSSAGQEELPARGKVLPASSGAVSGSHTALAYGKQKILVSFSPGLVRMPWPLAFPSLGFPSHFAPSLCPSGGCAPALYPSPSEVHERGGPGWKDFCPAHHLRVWTSCLDAFSSCFCLKVVGQQRVILQA